VSGEIQFQTSEPDSLRTRKLNALVNTISPLLDRVRESLAGHREVGEFDANDATPSVASKKKIFKTANTLATVITGFDGGVEGQEIVVLVNDAHTSFDFTGTTLKGHAGTDWTASNGDHIRATFIPPNWYVETFDNTP
jgi:hypothetical protein